MSLINKKVMTPKGKGIVLDKINEELIVEIDGKTYSFLVPEVDFIGSTESYGVTEAPATIQGGKGMKKKFNIKDLFKIDKIVNGEVALTPTMDIAVRRSNGDYITVDNKGVVTNLNGLAIPAKQFLMILPTPTLEVGDVIKTERGYVKVTSVDEKAIRGFRYETGTYTRIAVENNLLGIKFYQKVTNITALQGANGLNPMMLLALADDDSEKEIDATKLMLLSGAFSGKEGTAFNPLMLLALGDDVDVMTMMALTGGFGAQAGQAGAINPMMLMALGGGEVDAKSLLLMQAMGGQNPFAQQTTAVKAE